MLFDFKKLIVAFCVLIASVSFLFYFSSSASEESSDKLIVGLQSGYPPFEFKDKQGNIVGFDIDLAKAIARKLGKELKIMDMDFEAEILSLKQGKIDLIMSGMNITKERLKEIHMVPYFGDSTNSFSLLFWEKIPEDIHSLNDIISGSFSLSVHSGSISHLFLNNYSDIQIKSFEDVLMPLMDVKYGKSRAALVENEIAEYLKDKHSEIQVLKIPVPKEHAILGFGIGIKKENKALFEQVSSIIQELKNSGELQKLENHWFKKEIENLVE